MYEFKLLLHHKNRSELERNGLKLIFSGDGVVGRSKGTIISVKVPIQWDSMTDRQKTRLNRITGRDSRVIKAFLGVIERHEKSLLTGRKQTKIDASQLEKLTITATRGKANRVHVPHDFKSRFAKKYANEFKECI